MSQKYLVCLHARDGGKAVIIDFTPEAARQRAIIFGGGPSKRWQHAEIEIICMVRGSRMPRILALESKK